MWEDERSILSEGHGNSVFCCVLVALNKYSLIVRVVVVYSQLALIVRVVAVYSQLASYTSLLERHEMHFVVLNFNCLYFSCFKCWMHIETDFFKFGLRKI